MAFNLNHICITPGCENLGKKNGNSRQERCSGCYKRRLRGDIEFYTETNPKQIDITTPTLKRRRPVSNKIEHRDIVNQYKLESGCADCGYRACSVALDFDHLDPKQKSFNISQQVGRVSLVVLFAEIGKCEVVCSNCHRIRTHGCPGTAEDTSASTSIMYTTPDPACISLEESAWL